MKFSAKQYATALLSAVEESDPSDHDKILNNFVQVLAENNDLNLCDAVCTECQRQSSEKMGVKLVDVTSANPLNRENEKLIVEALNKYVKGQVELQNNLNEDLVGGVLIQADDLLIDASVKNSLERLKKDMQE